MATFSNKARMVDEDVILGLDIGVASIGWALVRTSPDSDEMHVLKRRSAMNGIQYGVGVRHFRVAEYPLYSVSLAEDRLLARSQRQLYKSNAKRRKAVRQLLALSGMPMACQQTLHQGAAPWQLRAEALERILSPSELAIVLLHIAKYRGFQLTLGHDNDDASPLLAACKVFEGKVSEHGTTVGAYLASLPLQRNRRTPEGEKVYDRIYTRDKIREELVTIFERQAAFGSTLVTQALRDKYMDIALASRTPEFAHRIGPCLIFPDETRAPACSPVVEKFRLVMHLLNTSVLFPDGEVRPLATDEIKDIVSRLGALQIINTKTFRLAIQSSWKRTELKFVSNDTNILPYKDARVSSAFFPGSSILYKTLGECAYKQLSERRVEHAHCSCLDYIVKLICEINDSAKLMNELGTLNLSTELFSRIKTIVDNKLLRPFFARSSLSYKALELIIPQLIEDRNFEKALKSLHLDKHPSYAYLYKKDPLLDNILKEVRRQTSEIINDWNVIPGRIHFELSREVGRSPMWRTRKREDIRLLRHKKKALRSEAAKALGRSPRLLSKQELLRYELWKEQGGQCAYYSLWGKSDGAQYYADKMPNGVIPAKLLRDNKDAVQIDYIMPFSKSFESSYTNKCLCCTGARADKKGLSPFEWIGKTQPDVWAGFREWVLQAPLAPLKKRNLLQTHFEEDAQKLLAHNYTNESDAAKLITATLQGQYMRWLCGKMDGVERVAIRTRAITNFLRTHWQVHKIRKDFDGFWHDDDRHPAIDAIIVAHSTEKLLLDLKMAAQLCESEGKDFQFPIPYKTFLAEASRAYRKIFVAWPLRIAKNGPIHKSTLNSIVREPVGSSEGGQTIEMLYRRVDIASLTKEDLLKIKSPERCPDVIRALSAWLALPWKERFLDCNLPRSARGDVIRHVKVRMGSFRSGIKVRRGNSFAHAYGKIVRADIYRKDQSYYIIPVFLKDALAGVVPTKFNASTNKQGDGIELDASYQFHFSIYPGSYLILVKNGTVRQGYVRHINYTGVVTLAPAMASTEGKEYAMRTCSLIRKYNVDRLGRLIKVTHEPDPRTFDKTATEDC